MRRFIERVDYRHPLVPTAYVLVTGRTEREAEACAKRTGTAISHMSPEFRVLALRPKGFNRSSKTWKFEVPVILGLEHQRARAAFAQMALRGRV